MAYTESAFPVWVVKNPILAACIILTTGTFGGAVTAFAVPGMNLFERFGALTTMLGVFVFGSLASELLVRAQGAFAMGNDLEPAGTFKFGLTRKALNWQTAVIAIGTLQWGFGSLIIAR
ncbi:hypothetical protein EOK75_02565 [Pseudorhodobacter turbinis]|uniref:Uncharacterized protein n=1 Tax=Pseudorhodobacter turbinis TaxID=2500533 RepID=A0A4P8ECZ6_9RHOB|nr:hypothetical protein [Pseudorhodobacter turbinis]QCO54770.1 hypothetical protein EOK75_02565 [Pseudorhodobacter turbinis]